MTHTLILEARGIVKAFPGVRALDGVDLEVRMGEAHALVGENGAGKSTLMHILGGILRPDAGEIRLAGQAVRFRGGHETARAGVSVVFQELSLSPNLSVAENIFANRQPVRGPGLVNRGRLYDDAWEWLKKFSMDVHPRTLVKHLSPAQQQVVEILKAMSHRPRVLILDEPTSSLTALDTQLLFRTMDELKAAGTSFIYISHHLPEIFQIADRVTVLRDGRHVATLPVADVTESRLVSLMVGRDLADIYGVRSATVGEPYFEVAAASGDGFRDVTLSLRRGEILGVAGLVGAGRTELARALFGVDPLAAGRMTLDGRPLAIRSPGDAIAAGLGYLTEDRKSDGLFLDMPIRSNAVAPSLGHFAGPGGWMRERAIGDFAEAARTRFRIATPDTTRRVRNLSGGNQQKVLLAMWMGIRPRVLIVDEPTRGVDVGARSEIYGLLRDLAAEGVGIIMISSDLLEILGLADRVLVLRRGRLAGEFTREEATEEKIIAMAAGVGHECPPT